jgi:hypothetical protein
MDPTLAGALAEYQTVVIPAQPIRIVCWTNRGGEAARHSDAFERASLTA